MLTGSTQVVVLAGVWAGAAAGVVFSLVWVRAPNWLSGVAYVSLGWFAMRGRAPARGPGRHRGARADLRGRRGYTAGAVVYALQRPDPRPAVFGYHEVFHVLVVAAAVIHFVAVAAFALPAAA